MIGLQKPTSKTASVLNGLWKHGSNGHRKTSCDVGMHFGIIRLKLEMKKSFGCLPENVDAFRYRSSLVMTANEMNR